MTFLSSDLVLLNSGSPTHFDSRTHSFSCIDLSLCSPSLALSFHWSVLDDFLYSDHFPILLTSTSYQPTPSPPRWLFDKADWATFTFLSDLSLPPTASPTIPDLLTFIMSTILTAAFKTIPQTKRSFTSKCVPWCNKDCTNALQRKRAAWRRYRRRYHTPGRLQAFIAFKHASAVLKRVVNHSKTQSWRSYVSSISSTTIISAVWRRLHKISGKYPPASSPSPSPQ